MAQITLDLATKIISKKQSIWAVFPGRGRRLLDIFLENRAIFLETPGLDLTPDLLEDDERLRRHIAMSEAIHDFLMGYSTDPPPTRPESYGVKRTRSFSAAVGNIRTMFLKMQPGDLVIVGGKSLYSPIHAGEIVKPFQPKDTIRVPAFGRFRVPARQVRWLKVSEERQFLSERLSRLLSNRKAVIHVNKQEFGEEVYTLAYRDFVFGENSRYIFEGPKYRNFAPATVPGIDLISYFMGAANAYELGELDKFNKLEIKAAIDQYFEQDVLYSFELDFSSPGSYIVHAKNASLALVLALLVSGTSDPKLPYPSAQSAEIVNSADHRGSGPPGNDTCPIPIKDEYRAIMESLGVPRYNELCKLNKDAQDGVGLRVGVKVKKATPAKKAAPEQKK